MQHQAVKSASRNHAQIGNWYKGFDDEQFICLMNEGWYVESREGEFGPFDDLKDAEDFYYKRFERQIRESVNSVR